LGFGPDAELVATLRLGYLGMAAIHLSPAGRRNLGDRKVAWLQQLHAGRRSSRRAAPDRATDRGCCGLRSPPSTGLTSALAFCNRILEELAPCVAPFVSRWIDGAAHFATSWARTDMSGGTLIPSAFAVFEFMTKSKLLGSITGNSPGLAPLRIRPAYTPA
jgi:hypothetical protein